MREAFARAIVALAEADPSIVVLTGDLGFGVLDEFRARVGNQLVNVGVAEQNLAGVAAGLALSGHRVLTYSIANFPTLRCLEQVRNDICYHDADVTIVAVGAGMAYGGLGASHFATEDLAILRALPGMSVVAPGDPVEVEALVPQIIRRGGPAYLRLQRSGEPVLHAPGTRVVLGEPTVVLEGADVCLLSTGGMLPVATTAADRLQTEHGLRPSVVSLHTLQPAKPEVLQAVVEGFRLVVTCEEHSIVGGLGGLIAEHLSEQRTPGRLVRFGLPRGFPQGIGSQEYLRRLNGIDATALVSRVAKAFQDL